MKSIPALILVSLLVMSGFAEAEITPLNRLTPVQLIARQTADATALLQHRTGLGSVIEFIGTQPGIFPKTKPEETRLLRREEKEVAWQAWERFLDYVMVVDSTEQFHADWWRLKGEARERSFLIRYTAMLANYRAALEFIQAAELNPELDKVLNDAVPELGLPAGTYAKLKFRFLNVAIATEFAANEAMMKTFGGNSEPALRAAITADSDYIWKTGRGTGEMLTANNALKILQRGAEAAWLPIQAGVSEWMGDTKVYRAGKSLISAAQVEQLKPLLQPGDVLLERREWYLSNVGLPGFWSHAALYIGTPEERAKFFADAEVKDWVRGQGEISGNLESLLQTNCSVAYEPTIPHDLHPIRIIEAISEGVSFTSLEHTLDCDSVAVLRPKLNRIEKARALTRAFHYAGRPYDFNFDFSTDAQLVCTELLYKSYEPADGFQGLVLSTVEMLGRRVTPANEFAKQFESELDRGKAQFDLVQFLDGSEQTGCAREGSQADFCRSWQRPKWHVVMQ